MANAEQPAAVSRATEAKQVGATGPGRWDWVERTVWTSRMLEALDRGVKGGVWFSLIDNVLRKSTLHRAFAPVKANHGAAGVDPRTIRSFEARLDEEIDRLHDELRNETYRPRPIRRVWIDKPGSQEQCPPGIPAVRDRVVQAAVRMVIEPIFEGEFAEHSDGFRPRRGAKDALRRVDALVKAADGRLLRLLEAFLSQSVMDGLATWTPRRGTPQGAVISPLLANLYLHPLDVAAREAGYARARYADDFVILCPTRDEADAALDLVRGVCAERGLTLHPTKTRIARERADDDDADGGAEVGFDFLGYHFRNGGHWVRAKSLLCLRAVLRAKTPRCSGRSLEAAIVDCNRTLRGWYATFQHSRPFLFDGIDGWLRRRLRSMLRKRTKRRGISKGYDHQRWPNTFFQARGLFSLEAAHAARLQSARG